MHSGPASQPVELRLYWRPALIRRGTRMSYVAWIVLGLIAGFIGSKIVNRTGEGLIMDIVLGIVGAVVGGWLAGFFGLAGVSGLNLYSIAIAIGGAIVVLLVYHAIRRAV